MAPFWFAQVTFTFTDLKTQSLNAAQTFLLAMPTYSSSILLVLFTALLAVSRAQDEDLVHDVYHWRHFECYSCSYLGCGDPFNETAVNKVSCDGFCYVSSHPHSLALSYLYNQPSCFRKLNKMYWSASIATRPPLSEDAPTLATRPC